MTFDPHQLAAQIKQKARSVGFDLVGIGDASPSKYAAFLRDWLAAGRAGEMAFLQNRLGERLDPQRFLPGAKSVVCVAMNYHVEETPERSDDLRIAAYARGIDYHEHVKPRLYEIADFIRDTVPGTQTKCGVDTVPVLERELAARAGIGWVGKNTMLIHPRIGSYTFLGEVLTTLELPLDKPMPDRCGTCTRCIDACPTQCISPYELDAKRCISYLTIEHESELHEQWRGKLDGWVFGCDVCQQVCPYNRQPPIATLAELQPRAPATISRETIENWTQEDYWAFTRRSAMRRVKLPQFKRNAAFAK